MAGVGPHSESQTRSDISTSPLGIQTGGPVSEPDYRVPPPPPQENREGDESHTLQVDGECQRRGATVDGVSDNSQQQQQQHNRRTDMKAEFSPLAAFPCHPQHGPMIHNSRLIVAMFAFWTVDTVQWIINFFASLAYFVVDADGETTFILSFFWLPLFSGLSFFSYYMFYTSVRMENGSRFKVAVIIMPIMILINMVAMLGITNFSTGFISGLEVIGKSAPAGGIMVLASIFFTLLVMARIFLLIAVIVSKWRQASSPYRQEF